MQYLQRSKDGLRSTATGVMDDCEPLCEDMEPSLVPLQDLPVHLTVESSFHSRLHCLYIETTMKFPTLLFLSHASFL